MGSRPTAGELGIRQFELEALIWVRDALDPSTPDHGLPDWIRFDMDNWVSADLGQPLLKCGTACCIGGSMEMYLAGMFKKSVGEVLTLDEYYIADSIVSTLTGGKADVFSTALDPLFYEYDSRKNSRRGGMAAIDRFLEGNTGDPWLTGFNSD